MKMNSLHYLEKPLPLAQQVAGFLSNGTEGRFADLSTVQVLTSTSGAARRIDQALKEAGAKSPYFTRPMQALLPDLPGLASRHEQEAAWAITLGYAEPSLLLPLFDNKQPESTNERLKAAGILCGLCDQLAEAAQNPAAIRMTDSGFDDSVRWRALEQLYKIYLDKLAQWNRIDPNEARLAQIKEPDTSVQHLLVACIPDLPVAVERYAQQLQERGTQVDILIWQPEGVTPSFDAWGRPDPEFWSGCPIELMPNQIQVAAEASEEAKGSITYALKEAPAQNCGIILADPKLDNPFRTELWTRGLQAYDPDGDRLIQSQSAVIAIEWEAFRTNRDLRTLRRLLELPAFIQSFKLENPLTPEEALAACDYLLAETVSATLEQGQSAADIALPENTPKKVRYARSRARRLLAAVQSLLKKDGLALVRQIFDEASQVENQAADRVIELGNTLAGSPAFADWPEGFAAAFSRALRSEQLQRAALPEEVALNGWLEAPWLETPELALCGLIEGRLPGTIDGHPFLPDSIRADLGLSDNDSRLARDAYLLDCLLRSRSGSKVQCSYSKFDAEGNPNRPSRLLLRCHSKDLPQRVLQLTAKQESTKIRPRRQTDWRWRLPEEKPLSLCKISPTQFKDYLACPFRFCLKHILTLDAFTPAAREMNAATFGTLIHHALESFGRIAISRGEAMLQMTEDEIRTLVLQAFAEATEKQFGPKPSPAVQIQMANARTRLVAFARVQAQTFAEGWLIVDVERKLAAEDAQPLHIGSLPLSGVVDRIDRHMESNAWRVMDYKTFSTTTDPASKHFGGASAAWLPEAEIHLATSKAWIDLQLPLYRSILDHWHRPATDTQPPSTAYFILPSDPYETAIRPFVELDDGVNPQAYPSALQCAEAIVKNIDQGIFWPPRPFRGNWDDPYAPLFVNGTPEDSIHPETIERLKGASS
jgi:ATP-dependent helicase/nuclease subunit B